MVAKKNNCANNHLCNYFHLRGLFINFIFIENLVSCFCAETCNLSTIRGISSDNASAFVVHAICDLHEAARVLQLFRSVRGVGPWGARRGGRRFRAAGCSPAAAGSVRRLCLVQEQPLASLSLLRAHNLSLTTAQPCVLIESICGWASLPRRQFEPQHANLATESRTKEQRSNNAQDKLLTKYGASDHCVDCAQDVDWWWVFANIFHSLLFFHFYFRQTWLNLNLL